MLVPGATLGATGWNCTVAADPVATRFVGGIGVDASGNPCFATGAPAGGDSFVNGFRVSANGGIRASVSGGSGVNYNNGYWFTDDNRLRISDGVSAIANWSNGDPFVGSGRLALTY